MMKSSNTSSTPSTSASSDDRRPESGQADPLGQREQLARSERAAKRTQPDNYQQQEAESKVVSTEQSDPHDVGSIHGLDNRPGEQRRADQA